MADPFHAYEVFSHIARGSGTDTGKGISFSMDYTSKKSIRVQESLQDLTVPFATGGEYSWNSFSRVFRPKSEWLTLFQSLSDEEKAKVEADIGNNKIPIEQLVKISTTAPFGKGSETVVDEKVRKATEIPAEKIPSSLFDGILPGIQDKLNKDMKPTGVLWVLKPYKMHIYGVGGKFDPHVDTLHDSNHVATLVVGLGTKHKGGQLVVTHQDKEVSFKLFGSEEKKDEGEDNFDWAAFYTDCTHEVKEVTEGWRAVMQYDIYETSRENIEQGKKNEEEGKQDEGKDYEDPEKFRELVEGFDGSRRLPQAKRIRVNSTAITALLENLKQYLAKSGDKGISFLMRHRYAVSALNQEALKGADRIIYDALESSGRFHVSMTCLVLFIESDYEGYYSMNDLCLSPVSMHDFAPESHDTPTFPCKEAFLVPDDKGRNVIHSLMSKRYIEYTGNEAEPGHYSYYFACFVVALKKNDK